MTRRYSILVVAALLALVGCDNSPSAVAPGEVVGTLQLPSGRSAMVVEFFPSNAVSSISIGPAQSSADAYFVSPIENGRVLIYSPGTFPERMNFRAQLADPVAHAEVSARVRSTSTADGATDQGEGAAVLIR